MFSRRNHRLDNSPFGIGQIAWVTKAASIRGAAVFRCPHQALPENQAPGKNHIRFMRFKKFPDSALRALVETLQKRLELVETA